METGALRCSFEGASQVVWPMELHGFTALYLSSQLESQLEDELNDTLGC